MTVYKEVDRLLYDTIFNKDENINDLVLSTRNLKHATLGYSDVYFKGKKPLLYKAEFHLHFERINDTITKIKINTINPKVVIGKQRITMASHKGYKYKTVEPTTIEEYKILLRIGKIAGEKKMPFINLPEQKYNIP
ncbi:MAG TPA: hypothetical protein DEH40_12560 [Marinilabiliales bacterium]|nr:hypothetical protein [Marinilabiliales bacterium]